MTTNQAEQWQRALASYRYPINGASELLFGARLRLAERWFNFDLERGDRDETMRFEARFREFGPRSIEAWYEVIFWKLASTGKRGEYLAGRLVENLRSIGYRAPDIWKACSDFVESGGQTEFKVLQHRLFLTSGALAVAATFPAFMCPERFPMVDARWVYRYLDENPVEAEARGLVLGVCRQIGTKQETKLCAGLGTNGFALDGPSPCSCPRRQSAANGMSC